MALCFPELICFGRCFHRTMFRNVKRPSILQFITVKKIKNIFLQVFIAYLEVFNENLHAYRV